MEMYLSKAENEILSLSKYVKEISIIMHNNEPFVFIYPDFEKLKLSKIINIEEELHWYAIELYNMEVEPLNRLEKYKILTTPLPRDSFGKVDKEQLKLLIDNDEAKKPDITDTSENLISYLAKVTSKEVTRTSHIELDLGLDSLDYVELFLYIEHTFGVEMNEEVFADLMVLEDLCRYIQKHEKFNNNAEVKLSDILSQPIDKKLIFSPINMFLYKIFLYPLFKLYFRLELKGEQNIPKTPCIFAPSHQSMLDGFAVLTTLPFSVLRKTFFLSYKQVFGKGILKPMAENGQNILIDANEHLIESLKYTALPLKEKNNLVIFPEGARTRNRKLLKFKPFFAILSKTFNVPIIPVVVDGGFEALKTGSIFPKPKKMKVTYLEAIYPDSLSIKEITDKTKNAIDEQMIKDPIKLH